MNSTAKTVVFWIVIAFSAFLLWKTVSAKPNVRGAPEISYSEFLSQVESGSVLRVTISQTQVDGLYRDNSPFRVTAPASQEGMLQTLHQKNVEIWFRDTPSGGWPATLMNLMPLVLLAALWFFMIRQMKSKQAQIKTGNVTTSSDSRWSNQ